MVFPKIIILAQGGTHGDFLYQACNIITSDTTSKKVDARGRVSESSILKRLNSDVYEKGQIKSLMATNLDNAQPIEICHIWFEEFIDWPSKFYYIDYDYSLIKIIRKMYIEKVFDNNIDMAIEDYKRWLPDSVSRKINQSNFNKAIDTSYKTLLLKYKKQPNAKAINMVDLYSFEKVVAILKDMDIYNETNLSSLKLFHSLWIEKNQKWIKQIHKISE